MRLSVAGLILILVSPIAKADLSWEYVDERTRQAEELLEQRPAIEAIAARERARQETEPSQAERKAYQDLSTALATHPEMAEVNKQEALATKNYQNAVAGGNNFEISITEQKLAKAKAARYQKATSVPQLKLAIEKWQQAAISTDEAESEETKSPLDAIQSKLKALSEAMGR